MNSVSRTAEQYDRRRSQIEQYFDRTAVQAWARLTSDAPVSGVRATVRAGRESMRRQIVSWLGTEDAARATAPESRLAGTHLLDAGCGTGMLSIDAARLGAKVAAVDLSATLVSLAAERLPEDIPADAIRFSSGDMLDPDLGEFDYLVTMDALIHYSPLMAVQALAGCAPRVRRSMIFTFAPANPLLMTMFALGRLFPRGDRSPAIWPVSLATLTRLIGLEPALRGWRIGRTGRVTRGFYISQALELVRVPEAPAGASSAKREAV